MLQSKLIGNTQKEWPKEASIKSHGLLIKGGYIRQMASGIYTLLPLAKKVTSKIENIIREEMNKIDSQEILMPLVATKKLWDMSGRYDSVGSELLRFKDRNDTDMVLSMTHEEATVYSLINDANTYQKYPFSVYQIQTKFRDEARPRAGLIRVREFTMKDAYSFHTTKESLDEEYDKFYKAYENIYRRVGIPETIAVASDTGMMGGDGAHEYMLLCDAGEDKIVVCNECHYSANMEVAKFGDITPATTEEKEIEIVSTPNIKTIEDLEKFLGVSSSKMCKAVVYERLDTKSTIVVFIRADREVNETKLRNLLQIDDEDLIPKTEDENNKDDKLTYGSIGPKDLNVSGITVVYDISLKNEKNLVCGANKKDYHYTGLSVSRDIGNVDFVDVSKVDVNDACPVCGKHSLNISNGIEVGNIFKLGDKYTKSMNMTYLSEDGKKSYPIMGCYGIGVGRLMASVLEARGKDNATNWPLSIAPFSIHICPIDYTKDSNIKELSNSIYEKLLNMGYEVLLDDRNKTAGVKFADSDLIGAPIRVVIGKKNLENNKIELKIQSNESKLVDVDNIYDAIKEEYDILSKEGI